MVTILAIIILSLLVTAPCIAVYLDIKCVEEWEKEIKKQHGNNDK